MTTSCVECRYGLVKKQKIRAGTDKRGKAIFDYIPKYLCTFDDITHATDQTSCPGYLGDMTLFEYLTLTQPQRLYDLLAKFELKVTNSRNKYGFNIINED